MIKLIDIIQELNIGKRLFADPTPSFSRVGTHHRLTDLLKALNIPYEYNTDDENAVLKSIEDYLRKPQNATNLKSNLLKLLPLKSQYPQLLDPAQDPYMKVDFVYRGATIDTKKLVNLVNKNGSKKGSDYEDFITVRADGMKVTTNTTRGFLSFTANKVVAETFATDTRKQLLSLERLAQRYPAVLKCDINDMSDKLILAPSFADALVFSEQETICIGNTFPCYEVLVVSPSALDNLGTPKEVYNMRNSLPDELQELMVALEYIDQD